MDYGIFNLLALRGENANPFHVHNQNRVIAFHRWLEGTGQDVIVVATLAESTWFNYASGPPLHGFQASANIVIPANGLVVFTRD